MNAKTIDRTIARECRMTATVSDLARANGLPVETIMRALTTFSLGKHIRDDNCPDQCDQARPYLLPDHNAFVCMDCWMANEQIQEKKRMRRDLLVDTKVLKWHEEYISKPTAYTCRVCQHQIFRCESYGLDGNGVYHLRCFLRPPVSATSAGLAVKP